MPLKYKIFKNRFPHILILINLWKNYIPNPGGVLLELTTDSCYPCPWRRGITIAIVIVFIKYILYPAKKTQHLKAVFGPGIWFKRSGILRTFIFSISRAVTTILSDPSIAHPAVNWIKKCWIKRVRSCKLLISSIIPVPQKKSPDRWINLEIAFFILKRLLISPPCSRGCQTIFQVGLLTLGSCYLPRLPIQLKVDSDILRFSSPITATGSLPIFTGFPFTP